MAISHNIPAICLDKETVTTLSCRPDRTVSLLSGVSSGIEHIYSARYVRHFRSSTGAVDQKSLCGTVAKDEG